VGEILWSHIELAQWLRGLDQWVIDIAKRQDVLEALFQKLWDYQTPICDAYLKAVGKYVDVVFIGDDLGMQDRLLVKYADFVTYLKPWLKRRVEFIKERTDNKPVVLHSCGSIYKAIPDLIEIGLDGINPLQPFAKNMEPERLKTEFGDRLFFLGGLDHQHILPKTVDEVKSFVKRLIKAYAPGGGFIIAPTHDIPPVPVENIFAAFDHVMEIGNYPIQLN
jgi:uroporphyrinogen decarboxylase